MSTWVSTSTVGPEHIRIETGELLLDIFRFRTTPERCLVGPGADVLGGRAGGPGRAAHLARGRDREGVEGARVGGIVGAVVMRRGLSWLSRTPATHMPAHLRSSARGLPFRPGGTSMR